MINQKEINSGSTQRYERKGDKKRRKKRGKLNGSQEIFTRKVSHELNENCDQIYYWILKKLVSNHLYAISQKQNKTRQQK